MEADGRDPPAAILRRWIRFGKRFLHLIFLRRKWAYLGHFLRDQARSEYRPQRSEWGFLGTHLQQIKRRGRLTLAEQIPPRERARAAAEPEPAPEPARAAPAGKGAGKGRRGQPARDRWPPWLVHERVYQNQPIPGLGPAAQINVNVNIVNNAGTADARGGREGAAQAAPGGEAARDDEGHNVGRR